MLTGGEYNSSMKYTASRLSGLVKLKGKTYEEVFGPEKAKAMKEKMRLAKLGKKMPWNKGFKRENHPRWIKDRTKVKKYWTERNNPEYKQWRMSVFKRDNFKCRIGNSECSEKIISHHILPWRDYPELRYEINNGITLCHAHHPRKRAEEKRLTPYFNQLVSVSKA